MLGEGLSPRDLEVLSVWLRAKFSLDDVLSISSYGLVGNERFSHKAVRAFVMIWSWSAVRLEGDAGMRQSRFEQKCGKDKLDMRIIRVQQRVAQFLGN